MLNVIPIKRELNEPTPDDLMTLDEIESKYKIKYNTAYKHIVLDSKIPYYKIGRNIRVSEKAFLSYINCCLIPSKRV